MYLCYCIVLVVRILCDWYDVLLAMIKAYSKASSGVCLFAVGVVKH